MVWVLCGFFCGWCVCLLGFILFVAVVKFLCEYVLSRTDGCLTSCAGNEGREYVLRRILRRAVRYGTEVLKAQPGFFNG